MFSEQFKENDLVKIVLKRSKYFGEFAIVTCIKDTYSQESIQVKLLNKDEYMWFVDINSIKNANGLKPFM